MSECLKNLYLQMDKVPEDIKIAILAAGLLFALVYAVYEFVTSLTREIKALLNK